MQSLFQSTQRINSVLVQHKQQSIPSNLRGSQSTLLTNSTTELMLSSTVTRTETVQQPAANLNSSNVSPNNVLVADQLADWSHMRADGWHVSSSPNPDGAKGSGPVMPNFCPSCASCVSCASCTSCPCINPEQSQEITTTVQRPPIESVIGPFDGKYGSEVDSFLGNVWRYHVQYMLHPNQLLQEVPALLHGRAARWWTSNRDHIHTWNQFDASLRSHFNQSPPDHLILNQFYNMHQESNEQPLRFVGRARALLGRLHNRFNEQQEVCMILQHMHSPVRAQINADLIQTYTDLESQLKALGERMIDVRSRTDEPDEHNKSLCTCLDNHGSQYPHPHPVHSHPHQHPHQHQHSHPHRHPRPDVDLNHNHRAKSNKLIKAVDNADGKLNVTNGVTDTSTTVSCAGAINLRSVACIVAIQIMDFVAQPAALGAGCSHNLLDKQTYCRLRKRNVPMKISTVHLQSLSSHPVSVTAKHFRFTMTLGNRELVVTFTRISKQKWPPICILGQSFLESLDLDINYKQQYFRFRDDHRSIFPLLNKNCCDASPSALANNQLVITSALMNLDFNT